MDNLNKGFIYDIGKVTPEDLENEAKQLLGLHFNKRPMNESIIVLGQALYFYLRIVKQEIPDKEFLRTVRIIKAIINDVETLA